jgi:hypothetical protein
LLQPRIPGDPYGEDRLELPLWFLLEIAAALAIVLHTKIEMEKRRR